MLFALFLREIGRYAPSHIKTSFGLGVYRFFGVIACFLLFVVGCASDAQYVRPVAPIPQTWPVAVGVPVASTSPVQWKAYFRDPALQALIEGALANNKDLQVAAARVLESRAQYGIAKAERFPTLTSTFSGASIGTASDFSGNGLPANSQRFDLNVATAGFEIDVWGRLAGLTEAARASYLATEDARRTVRLGLIADVASGYYSLLQAQEMVELAKELIAARLETLKLVEKGRDIGGTYGLEVEMASNALEASRASLDGLVHQHRLALNRLSYLAGYSLSLDGLRGSLPRGTYLERVGVGVPSAVLLERPDVLASELRLKAAHANVDAARAAFLPRILLTSSVGLASQALGSLFSGGAWLFQPAISLPLFDGGRLDASRDLAEARRVVAVAEYERTIQQAFREVSDLLSSKKSLDAQASSAIAQLRSQEARFKIANARYEGGVASYLEVLESRRDLIGAREMDIQIRRAQLEVSVQLFKALGGAGLN